MTDWCGGSWLWKSPAGKESWQWAEQEQSIQAEGVVYRIEKDTRTMIYLKKTILIRSGSSKKYPIRNIKCTGKKEALNSLREGMRVRLEGTLALPELPRNPGQFNRRVYESGKKIDFYLEDPAIVWSKEGSSGSTGMLRVWREEIKKRCKRLYPDTEAGILEAMLFGEKSELTGEVKGFYQAAGISHVLDPPTAGTSDAGMGVAICGGAVWVRHTDRTADHSGPGTSDVLCASGRAAAGPFLRSLIRAGICRDPDASG